MIVNDESRQYAFILMIKNRHYSKRDYSTRRHFDKILFKVLQITFAIIVTVDKNLLNKVGKTSETGFTSMITFDG